MPGNQGRRGNREAMSSVDRAWLQMDSTTNLMIINGLMVFDQALDFAQVSAILERRLVGRFARFRQHIVSDSTTPGRYYWQNDPLFDVRHHIRHLALPAPGDKAELQRLLSDLMSDPLSRLRPMWQFYLIDNVDGGSAVLGRIHHCIADGIALIQVLLSLTDASAEAEDPKTIRRPRRRQSLLAAGFKMIQQAQTLSATATRFLLHESIQIRENPAHVLELAKSAGIITTGTAMTLARLLLLPPDAHTVFKGDLGVSKLVSWSEPIDLKLVKQIGQDAGATVNDVLVAAVAGALRRYMVSCGQTVDGVNVRAMVPVNLRPLDQKMQPDNLELGNKFALVYLTLPVSLRTARERLHETKQRMDTLKNSPDAFVVFQVLNLLGTLPGELADWAVNMFASKATAVLTNVPGPRKALYFAGSPIQRMMFWVPQSGQIGLGISILSYADTVTLGIMVDERLAPDPERIIAEFQMEVIEMRKRDSYEQG